MQNSIPIYISLHRCILIKETNELRHMKNIQRALSEIDAIDTAQKDESSSSMKAYQTIKCELREFKLNLSFILIMSDFQSVGMIALKRKLKRIRENKEH